MADLLKAATSNVDEDNVCYMRFNSERSYGGNSFFVRNS